jgi:hypothetical protein
MKRLLLIFAICLGMLASAVGQVVPGGGVGGTITGQIQTATGGSITNGTLTFSLSQPAILSNTATLSTNQVACYTSAGGNITGVPDPLVLPIVSVNLASGTLPAATYYVKLYYFNASGNSIASPEVAVSLSGGTLIVTPPSLQPGSATGYGVAISATSGAEVIQGTVTGWTQFQQSQPLLSGSAAPTVNTSSCNIYFSDQLVPTGTYYTVNLINRNGSQVAGFPQSWCTYGGAGGVINVSQGAPTGNCNVSGVFYPTPIFASPANNATQSVASPIAFPGGITTIGGNPTFTGSPTACSMNGLKYIGGSCAATWGGDIGAQHNAAAATCIGGSNTQCRVVLLPGPQQTFSTPMVFVPNETLECARVGALDTSGGSDSIANLFYTGTGTGITMGKVSGRILGCDLVVGPTSLVGVQIGTNGAVVYENHLEDFSIRGGGASTTLVHVSCGPAGACNDESILNARFSDYLGTALGVDYAGLNVINTSIVAKVGSNGLGLVIDSGTGGFSGMNVLIYNNGLHDLVVRNTLGGPPPVYMFLWNLQGDTALGDAFLFDSSLGTQFINFLCNECWAAGAGGSGVNIQGGSGIRFGANSIIRANSHDGVTLGAGVSDISIQDSYIQGNNAANAGYNGISISGHPISVVVTGNTLNNATGGSQQYGLSTSGDVEGLTYSGNNCTGNIVGCANLTSVTPSKLTYFGNTNVVLGLANEPSFFPGSVTASTGVFTGGAAINVTSLATPTAMANTNGAFGLLSVRDQSLGGVAVFILDPNSGAQLLGTSGIAGLSTAAGVTYSSGWRIALSSGSVPRLLNWTIFQ